jgi:hypothetical protein
MNITRERTEESILKHELENEIKFNKRLLKEIAGGFLFNLLGSYNCIHLISLDHLISKYEKESDITILQRKAIEKITEVHLSMVIIKIKGYDYSIIKQWIAETEAELVELVKKADNTEGK